MESVEMKPNEKKIAAPMKKGPTILLVFLGFLLALGALVLWVYHGFTPVVHGEYGQGVPAASAFCNAENAFVWADEDAQTIGRHMVKVIAGVRVVPCLLIVEDTTAPAAEPVTLEFPSGYVPRPDEFITDLQDADRVAVSFLGTYDFSAAGEQPVHILLEDGSGNQSEVVAAAAVRAAVERVIVEAGSPIPSSDLFLTEGFHGELLDTITDEMMHTPGEYALSVRCPENGRVFLTTLEVRDTAAPTGTGQLLILEPGADASPEAFLTESADETALTYSFALAPDPDSREIQDIAVRITDAGGNSTDVPAQVLYSSFGALTVEARNGLLTGSDLGRPEAQPEEFPANVPGTYFVRVQVNGGAEIALVTLVDTTGPILTRREGSFYTRHDLTPEDLVEAEDVTGATLSFVAAPDQDSDQEQTFSVRAVDGAGNETVSVFPLTLQVDTTPPILYGVVNVGGYVNEPIAYFKEAYAEDDVDGRVEMTVESQVILSRRGKYTVTYSATDKSGNTASKSCTYTLVDAAVTDADVRRMAQGVLKEITTNDMVTAEKLKAVFEYVRGRIHYTGVSNKTDWRREAIRGNEEGKGDCFTVYCLSRALLDELKISYMSVTRKGGSTHHYWLIVNIGTGWYHFDPLRTRVHNYSCFMWTTKQCLAKPYFWRFYEENYPAIATELFNYDAVVQLEKEGKLP